MLRFPIARGGFENKDDDVHSARAIPSAFDRAGIGYKVLPYSTFNSGPGYHPVSFPPFPEGSGKPIQTRRCTMAEIKWLTSFDEGMSAAKAGKKLVFLDFFNPN